jgi:Zn-dependent oligopeptidase
VNDEIPAEEKNNAIKQMKRILDEFEDTLKTAENVYEDAVKKGDVKIKKEKQKKIEKIKREEASLHNIILELGGKV